MANLTEHVMINKWDNDINEAINAVGGNTEGSSGLPDYASIIREQLVAKGIAPSPGIKDSIILEGDSCIIEADEKGYDYYNTEYAIGVKTGLIPNTLYLRLCTTVKDIEPVYIDMTRVFDGIDINIDEIVDEVLKKIDFKETIQEITVLQQDVEVVQNQINQVQNTKVDVGVYEKDQLILNTKIEAKVDEQEVKIIVDRIFDDNKNNEGINVEELNWD